MCGGRRQNKGPDAQTLMTSAGAITLWRRHWACPDCQANGYADDEHLGLDGYLSVRLLRLACLAAADHAFTRAADYLQAFCGVPVVAETVRLECERRGQRLAAWQPASAAVAAAFAAAAGEVELQMDAGKANTLEGWRDVKLACFAKRPLGQPASVAAWNTRELPAPQARTMFAAIEPIEVFQKRLRPQAVRLGITDPAAVHLLGDGTEWIWNTTDSHFPRCRQTLDVYHGHENVGKASKKLYGEGTAAAAWSGWSTSSASSGIVLPQVGCGHGRLDWQVVRLSLAPLLDDRFTVVSSP